MEGPPPLRQQPFPLVGRPRQTATPFHATLPSLCLVNLFVPRLSKAAYIYLMLPRASRPRTIANLLARAPPLSSSRNLFRNLPLASSRLYTSATSIMADRVHRVTLIKLPKEEDQKLILDQYRKLAVDHKKVPPLPPSDYFAV